MGLSKAEIEELTNRHYDDIYKFCVSRCGNKEDGADITQSVFLLFMQRADVLENKRIKSWLISVASLKVKEYFRQKEKDCSYLRYEDCDDIIDDSQENDKIIEDFEKLLNDTQKKILSVLTEKEKAVFIKRFIEKKSICIVADELETTEGNVRVHSNRAKNKAKKVISTTELLINIILFKYF